MKRWIFGWSLAVALLMAVGCGDDDGGGDDRTLARDTDSQGEEGSPPGAPLGGAVTGGAGEDGSPGEAPAYSQVDRKIIVNGMMALEAPDVAQAFSLAGRAARNAGGFVEESKLGTRRGVAGEDEPHATITLRVPAVSYDAVLDELRGISGVRVTSEGVASDEVTEEYTDLQSRLRNLERTESQYLDLLAKAATIEEILTVSDRLDGVRAQIEQTQGRITLLDSLTEYATIDVSIAPLTAAAVEEPKKTGPGAVFAEAWDWSLEVAAVFGVAGVYLLVAAAWLVLPAGIAGMGWALVRKRRGAAAV